MQKSLKILTLLALLFFPNQSFCASFEEEDTFSELNPDLLSLTNSFDEMLRSITEINKRFENLTNSLSQLRKEEESADIINLSEHPTLETYSQRIKALKKFNDKGAPFVNVKIMINNDQFIFPKNVDNALLIWGLKDEVLVEISGHGMHEHDQYFEPLTRKDLQDDRIQIVKEFMINEIRNLNSETAVIKELATILGLTEDKVSKREIAPNAWAILTQNKDKIKANAIVKYEKFFLPKSTMTLFELYQSISSFPNENGCSFIVTPDCFLGTLHTYSIKNKQEISKKIIALKKNAKEVSQYIREKEEYHRMVRQWFKTKPTPKLIENFYKANIHHRKELIIEYSKKISQTVEEELLQEAAEEEKKAAKKQAAATNAKKAQKPKKEKASLASKTQAGGVINNQENHERLSLYDEDSSSFLRNTKTKEYFHLHQRVLRWKDVLLNGSEDILVGMGNFEDFDNDVGQMQLSYQDLIDKPEEAKMIFASHCLWPLNQLLSIDKVVDDYTYPFYFHSKKRGKEIFHSSMGMRAEMIFNGHTHQGEISVGFDPSKKKKKIFHAFFEPDKEENSSEDNNFFKEDSKLDWENPENSDVWETKDFFFFEFDPNTKIITIRIQDREHNDFVVFNIFPLDQK